MDKQTISIFYPMLILRLTGRFYPHGRFPTSTCAAPVAPCYQLVDCARVARAHYFFVLMGNRDG